MALVSSVPGGITLTAQAGAGRDFDLSHGDQRDLLARTYLLGDLDRRHPLPALQHQEACA